MPLSAAWLGMAIAEMGVRALVALSPAGLPRVGAIRVDGAVFAFGLGITTLVGLRGGADAGATGVPRRSAYARCRKAACAPPPAGIS